MQITFRASPKLLRVSDIGECVVGANDSFRRQFSIVILGALRARKIPFRNPNGIKLPPESLDITEKQMRDFAKRRIEEDVPVPIREFDDDLQRVIPLAAAQPWMNVETQLQALATEGEKFRQWVEAEIDIETDRLLDVWYRDGSVQVSEAAEWFCNEHDFEGTIIESNSAGEIAQKLAKWFDSPIDDVPLQLRPIAEAYIPGWPEMSGADRRARADEADRQLQAVRADRFEKASREKEQAESDPIQVAADLVAWCAQSLNAATWWNLSALAPREAAMLLCRFNPHDDKLDPLSIVTDETGPDDFKRLLRVFEDVARSQSQARTLSDWHDIARDKRLKYHSWIDAFRQAVSESEQTADTPRHVRDESHGQSDAARSGVPKVTPVDDGGQGKAATQEQEQKAPIGIPKGQILSVDWPLPPGAPTLQNIIDNLPKWVEEACTKVGRVGKGPGGSHLWNPAILAVCLATKTPQKQWAAGKGALTSFLRRSFPDYLKQWEEAAKSL